jgi:hypothetical protein
MSFWSVPGAALGGTMKGVMKVTVCCRIYFIFTKLLLETFNQIHLLKTE